MNGRRINGESGLLAAATRAVADQAGKVPLDEQIDEVSRWIAQCSQAKADMARRGQLDKTKILEPALLRQRAILQTLMMVRAGITGQKVVTDIVEGLDGQMVVVIFRAIVDKFGGAIVGDDALAVLELEPALFADRVNVRVEWRVTPEGGFIIRTLPIEPGTPPAPVPEIPLA